MNTTTSAVMTGTIVTVGRWSEGHGLDEKVIVGSVFLAVGLAILGDVNTKFASQLGVLVLVAATLRYAIPIVQQTGLATPSKTKGTVAT